MELTLEICQWLLIIALFWQNCYTTKTINNFATILQTSLEVSETLSNTIDIVSKK